MPLSIKPRQSTKRKASSNPTTPAKKVRIVFATDIPDQTVFVASGRPKRASFGDPQHKFASRRSSSTQNSSPAIVQPDPTVKRRGRPPKTSTSPAHGSEEQVAPKKRGRPAK